MATEELKEALREVRGERLWAAQNHLTGLAFLKQPGTEQSHEVSRGLEVLLQQALHSEALKEVDQLSE